jgi:predicted amidohydrolase YtcJ
MTIWAAYGSFSEKDTGSLEKGKEATFVILDQPLMISEKFSPNYAFSTFIRGEEVYQLE